MLGDYKVCCVIFFGFFFKGMFMLFCIYFVIGVLCGIGFVISIMFV